MMLSFAVTFWTLCSSNMQSPFTWTNPILPSISLNNSREAVEYLNFKAPWFSLPDLESGHATLGNPGSPFDYSTLQSSFVMVFSGMISGSFEPSSFNACGVSSSGDVNFLIRSTALLYQAVYTILVTIVMVNVLIAIMSDSYSRLYERGKAQVLFNQAQLFGESTYEFAKRAMENAFKKDTIQPKIMYTIKKKTIDEAGVDDDDDEAKDEDDHAEKMVARALLATKELAENLNDQFGSHTEELAGSVLENMDKVHGLQRELDTLIKTKNR